MEGGGVYKGATDVLILGGGPAGLRAAQECALQGLTTVVVERKKEVGSPTQTSGATWIEDMVRHGVPAACCHRVDTVRFLSPNREARFRNTARGLGVLDVRGTYQHMAQQAVENGAHLYVGTRVLEPVVRSGKVCGALVRTPQGKEQALEALVTIDATGFASVVARHLFGFGGFRRYGLGLEYDLYAPRWPEGDFVLLVGLKAAPQGYAWAFPWGSHRVRVGVGVTMPPARGVDLSVVLKRLIEEDARLAPYLKGSGCLELHRGFIPDEPFPLDPVADGLLIIGDAAGQASCLAGEGIRFAMDMGVLAARAAGAAVKKGDARKEVLEKAHRAWRKKYGRSFWIAMEINKRMTLFTDDQWDKAATYLNRLTDRQFLQFLKTELSFALFAGILARNPDLAGKALFRKLMKELEGSRNQSFR